MGIAVGDYNNNGLVDLFNTDFSDDYNPLYRNDGDANFTDISYQAGIAETDRSLPRLGRRLSSTSTTMAGKTSSWSTATSTRKSTRCLGNNLRPATAASP